MNGYAATKLINLFIKNRFGASERDWPGCKNSILMILRRIERERTCSDDELIATIAKAVHKYTSAHEEVALAVARARGLNEDAVLVAVLLEACPDKRKRYVYWVEDLAVRAELDEEETRLKNERAVVRAKARETALTIGRLEGLMVGRVGRRLATKAGIIAAAKTIPFQPCIYFLVKDGEIVYIGQSISLIQRIGDHLWAKDFDSVAYMPCEQGHLDYVESLYIHAFQPALNGHAPVRLSDLIPDGAVPYL